MMKIIIKGQGTCSLNKKEFVGAGGEGEIYRKKQTAYKIYFDKKKVLPYAKIQELSAITDKNVISPKRIITDIKNNPIGYTMRYLSNTYSLCQTFTKAFKDRNKITLEMMLKLVLQMKKTIEHIHSKDILVVDLNEMNFLVDNKFTEVYFIDVDSYQTPSFPATAIMESIRDRHNPIFNKNTDWFSFGIVSFQMFCLIHPYKGKHPQLKTLDERMKANIPVFHKNVKYPKTCQSFDILPSAYKEWYKAIFYEGKRVPPPSDPQQIIIIPIIYHTIKSNDSFEIIELNSYAKNVIKYISVEGVRITLVEPDEVYVDNKKEINVNSTHFGITSNFHRVIGANVESDNIILFNIKENKKIECNISAENIMTYDGRIYIKKEDKICEIIFIELPNKTLVSSEVVTNVLENATKIFDGVVIQNVLGSCVASVFPKTKTFYQVIIPEIKGYQIVDSKFDKNVLIVIANKKGQYDKFVLKFNENFSSYELRLVKNISYIGINFIVLDNGIVVHINEDEEMEIFSNKIGKNDIKVIGSKSIEGDMKLLKDGIRVLFSQGNKIYRLKMKK